MSLLDEIRSLPAELRALQDTHAITDALNADRVVVGLVTRGDFAEWAAANGMRAKIEDHAVDAGSPLRSIALACRDVISGATDGIDLGRPANAQMLAAWVASGEITQAQANELIELGTRAAPVDEFTVRCLCWSDSGEWQV